MAVHVPLTQAAQIECWTLMMAVNNLLNPANGSPVVFPSLDMVLGINYLTIVKKGSKGEGKYYSSADEVLLALDAGSVEYNALIKVPINGEYIETTPGRIILMRKCLKFLNNVNYPLADKELKALAADCFKNHGASVTVDMLDSIKDLGFKYVTVFGATISMADIVIPDEKKDLIDDANNQVTTIQNQYQQGHITRMRDTTEL